MSEKGIINRESLMLVMRRSNYSDPFPRATPGTSLFYCCPSLLITVFLPCSVLINHFNHSFFQCPALFYHTHFSSDPEAAPRGMVSEKCDQHIRLMRFYYFRLFSRANRKYEIKENVEAKIAKMM